MTTEEPLQLPRRSPPARPTARVGSTLADLRGHGGKFLPVMSTVVPPAAGPATTRAGVVAARRRVKASQPPATLRPQLGHVDGSRFCSRVSPAGLSRCRCDDPSTAHRCRRCRLPRSMDAQLQKAQATAVKTAITTPHPAVSSPSTAATTTATQHPARCSTDYCTVNVAGRGAHEFPRAEHHSETVVVVVALTRVRLRQEPGSQPCGPPPAACCGVPGGRSARLDTCFARPSGMPRLGGGDAPPAGGPSAMRHRPYAVVDRPSAGGVC
jgi:hypothetical protein